MGGVAWREVFTLYAALKPRIPNLRFSYEYMKVTVHGGADNGSRQ